MQNAAAGWLTTSLDPDPLVVALVVGRTFAADVPRPRRAGGRSARRYRGSPPIVDRRPGDGGDALVAGFALMVWSGPGYAGPRSWASAFWAVLPMRPSLRRPGSPSSRTSKVPREHSRPAVALNGVGINVSRAVGLGAGRIIIVAWPAGGAVLAQCGQHARGDRGLDLVWQPLRLRGGAEPPAGRGCSAGPSGQGWRHARNNLHLAPP